MPPTFQEPLPDIAPPHVQPTRDAAEPPALQTGRYRTSIACGPPAPASIAAWWKEADAIVRVRIDSQYAYDDYQNSTHDPFILSELEVTVLEVFKAHAQAVAAGATMTVSHPGGTLMREDGPETHTTNDFPPPANGTEWFLFLT